MRSPLEISSSAFGKGALVQREADNVAGYSAIAACWGITAEMVGERPRDIPAYTDRARLYRQTSRLCIAAGCATSAAVCASTLEVGTGLLSAAAGAAGAVVLSRIASGTLRSRLDAFPDHPSTIPR